MGRSGGHSSGGRSGGGRSGGSRSSGRSARSSSSFSSSRSSSHSFSSSAGRPTFNRSSSGRPETGRPMGGYVSHRPTNRPSYRPMPRPFIPMGGGVFSGGMYGGGGTYTQQMEPVNQTDTIYEQTTSDYNDSGSSSNSGTGSKKMSLIEKAVIFVVTITVLVALFGTMGGGDRFTKSTINREKLHLNVSANAGYYTDECGWIRNRTTLEQGLKEFYSDTGILPYVYIIDNVDGDYDPSTQKLEQFAEKQYNALFRDEGHILLVFWDYAGAYEYTLWLGGDTLEIMDTEACDILFDYLDYYYYEAETEEEFFADAFADAGERMMHVTRSPGYYVFYVAIGATAVYLVFNVWKSRKEKEAERKRRSEAILNSPLEKFGDNGDIIDDLEKKYEKEI